MKVCRFGGHLTTDLFVKPTDTDQYWSADLYHPTSIPYSQALRLNRICFETSDFYHRCNELESWLMKRGYDEKIIRKKVMDAQKHKNIKSLLTSPFIKHFRT